MTDETASKEVSTNQPSGDVVEEAGQRIKCLIEGNSLSKLHSSQNLILLSFWFKISS